MGTARPGRFGLAWLALSARAGLPDILSPALAGGRGWRKMFSPVKKALETARVVTRPPLDPAEFPQPQTPTMLLGVSSRREDHALLGQVLHDTNWELREARGYRDALTILCNDRMPVIVCECCMPDGNWRDVLGQILVLPNAPRLIVAGCDGNVHVRTEVLNLGGYDVISRPLDKAEVLRSVSRAWQNWDVEWCRTSQRWRTLAVGA